MAANNQRTFLPTPAAALTEGRLAAARPGADSSLRCGVTCPVCDNGCLDYDGLLNLTCPECGFSLGGCYT